MGPEDTQKRRHMRIDLARNPHPRVPSPLAGEPSLISAFPRARHALASRPGSCGGQVRGYALQRAPRALPA